MPDFEAQIFARDIASVLEDAGWQARFVDASESQMPEMNFATGVMIFTLLDGKTTTEAGTALWTAMVNAEHEMGGEPFEKAIARQLRRDPKIIHKKGDQRGGNGQDPERTSVQVVQHCILVEHRGLLGVEQMLLEAPGPRRAIAQSGVPAT